ncbi:hypothetical protein [Kitasatospora sp. NPDC091276]|uniref:hypothetical protein n=1 Tax=Kitasatospora sp. NPDC091276 TaxID=3155300 RepID=UPI003441A926
MDAVEHSQQSRHRGAHQDPVGRALAVVWGLGHVVTLALLGIVAQHQLDAEHQFAAPPARALPDREPIV